MWYNKCLISIKNKNIVLYPCKKQSQEFAISNMIGIYNILSSTQKFHLNISFKILIEIEKNAVSVS